MESQSRKADQSRTRPDVEREYRNNQIVVHWEPRLCIHAGFCFRGLPAVFKPNDHPWVTLDGADADQIAQVVLACPTGALHFERLDGGPQEQPEDETTIKLQVNGPLYLRGKVRIVGPGNHVIREDTRVALCRCGASANKPFCDGSHFRVGFDTSEKPNKPRL
jgi:CDGSH-type Zn-finger protein/uncharacterized Fe-S cluster protein YjdI